MAPDAQYAHSKRNSLELFCLIMLKWLAIICFRTYTALLGYLVFYLFAFASLSVKTHLRNSDVILAKAKTLPFFSEGLGSTVQAPG